MSVVVEPIHVEGVNLGNVRFFAPEDGAREFPWPSIDDLLQAVGMDRQMRRAFKADLDNSPWRGSVRTIVTASGRTLIGQHFVAQGLIDAWAQVGRCSPTLYTTYAIGGEAAMIKLTEGMSFAELDAYCRDAREVGGGIA